MNYLNKFLFGISLLSSMTALADNSITDTATDHLTVSYPSEFGAIRLVIGLGKENGYRITCSGLQFGDNTTANLWIHEGLARNPKDINLTTRKLASKIEDISSEECTKLKAQLASATSTHPVVISIESQKSFSMTSK